MRLTRNWRPRWYRDFIVRRLPPDGVGAEIGVYRGDFSERLLAVARPRLLHLIDPWICVPEIPSRQWGGRGNNTQAVMDGIFEAVNARFAREIAAGRVRIFRGTSAEFFAQLAPASLDWIYLDGDHRAPSVRADLEAAWTRVRPGGLLLGDDVHLPNSPFGDGVTKGVGAFTADHGVRAEFPGRHQFAIVRSA